MFFYKHKMIDKMTPLTVCGIIIYQSDKNINQKGNFVFVTSSDLLVYIFATQCCKDIVIREVELVAKTALI